MESSTESGVEVGFLVYTPACVCVSPMFTPDLVLLPSIYYFLVSVPTWSRLVLGPKARRGDLRHQWGLFRRRFCEQPLRLTSYMFTDVVDTAVVISLISVDALC